MYDDNNGLKYGLCGPMFFEAKNNHTLRQLYIDTISERNNIDIKKILPCVRKITYVHDYKMVYGIKKPIFFELQKSLFSKGSPFNKGLEIQLFRPCFENNAFEYEADFLHNLFNRAGYDAYETYNESPVKTKFIDLFADEFGAKLQGLMDDLRVETYALSAIGNLNGFQYKMLLENLVSYRKKLAKDHLRTYHNFNEKSLEEIFEKNSPALGKAILILDNETEKSSGLDSNPYLRIAK
ncbi:MAG TPA: hypothetical protein VEC16_01060 [Alphaproteobacteria bacterium]|nr:hypothetical protein [Alphaproteobacteria bacterium]